MKYFGDFMAGNFWHILSLLETLWLETFWPETFWLETFWHIMSLFETLWPETFWPGTFWGGFVINILILRLNLPVPIAATFIHIEPIRAPVAPCIADASVLRRVHRAPVLFFSSSKKATSCRN